MSDQQYSREGKKIKDWNFSKLRSLSTLENMNGKTNIKFQIINWSSGGKSEMNNGGYQYWSTHTKKNYVILLADKIYETHKNFLVEPFIHF